MITATQLLSVLDGAEALKAADLASADVLKVRGDERLTEIARRMLERGEAHAFVEGGDGRHPVGVVSTLDIARVLGGGRPQALRRRHPSADIAEPPAG